MLHAYTNRKWLYRALLFLYRMQRDTLLAAHTENRMVVKLHSLLILDTIIQQRKFPSIQEYFYVFRSLPLSIHHYLDLHLCTDRNNMCLSFLSLKSITWHLIILWKAIIPLPRVISPAISVYTKLIVSAVWEDVH